MTSNRERKRKNTTEGAGGGSVSERRLRRRRELAVGDHVLDGRFALLGVLGRGGMGVVFEAFDQEVGEAVALKHLNWLDAGSLEQLKHEFRVLADVEHPNLVGLRGLYQDGDHCFFTMDLVRGVPFLKGPDAANVALATTQGDSLAETQELGSETQDAQQRTLPMFACGAGEEPNAPSTPRTLRQSKPLAHEARLRTTLRQLLAGVSAIHEAGKIHRDIKPSNVLVTEDDQTVILDFGLAGERPQTSNREVLDRISGTPAYMAPEQAAGLPPQPENDCYAVGVMLYEALTGTLPFRGTPGRVMADKQQLDPPPPRVHNAQAPLDLSDLCMRLLARDPRLRISADDALAALGDEPRKKRSSVRAPRPDLFVGRDALIRRMDALSHSARLHGRPTVIELSGASGLGKSALLQRFAELVVETQQALFLHGRCYEREGLPHKGIDQVLGELTKVLARNARMRDALDDVDLPALRTLLPDLPTTGPTVPSHAQPTGAPRAVRQRAYGALRKLLTMLSQRRLVVIAIDDMQWADSDGMRLLLDLMGGAAPPAVVWILSHRSDASTKDGPVATLHARMARLLESVDLEPLELQPLSAADSETLARQLLGEDATSHSAAQLSSICREAAGSPLLLGELTRHLAEQKTSMLDSVGALQDLLEQRLRDLSAEARRLFDVVCVSGRPIAPRLLATAAGVQGAEPWLRDLRQRRLLRACREKDSDAVDVFHDSIRERALSSLASETKRLLHAELARAYQKRADRHAEHLVTHWEGAGENDKAALSAQVAAQSAAAALAFDHAAILYRKAIELRQDMPRQERSELSLLLAEALSNGGRGAEAAPIFMRVANDFDYARGLELRRRAAEQWLVSGRTEDGLRALRGVLSEVGLTLPKGPKRAMAMLLLTRAQLTLRGLHFEPRREADIPRVELLRIDACRAAWALSFMNTIQGAAFQARYLQLSLRTGEPRRVALGLGMEAIFRSTKGTTASAEIDKLKQAQQRLARRLADPLVEAFVPLVQGQSSYMMGRWQRCSDSLATAEELLMTRCRDVTWELNSSRFFWGNALALQGRFREVGFRLHDWLQDAHERSDHYASASLELLSTRCVTLAADKPDAARRDIEMAMGRWQDSTFGVQHFLAEISRLQVALYEGRSDNAMACFERMWPAFTRSMMNQVQLCRIQAHQHAASALLAQAACSRSRAALLERATTHASRLDAEQAPWARPFASYVRAACAHLSGNDHAATAHLRVAIAQFRDVDMALYAAASQRRLGTLVGGEEGRRHIADSDAVYSREGIRNPTRLAAMMAPGFEP